MFVFSSLNEDEERASVRAAARVVLLPRLVFFVSFVFAVRRDARGDAADAYSELVLGQVHAFRRPLLEFFLFNRSFASLRLLRRL